MDNYEKIGLYPHNIETCKKVKDAFDDGEQIVSIIKATGTGKSYVGLYLALEYKDERIVWVVPNLSIKEHIEKTIRDNPKLSMERDFPNLEIITYQSLSKMNDEEIEQTSCDMLIVDELHHLGAPVWGERVNYFVDSHLDMRVFGMSAYSVRDRGTAYERDMVNPDTEELFSDTVVDRYDLYDAIIDGVLPKPIVRSVITEDSEIIQEIREKIELLKNKGDKSYLEYQKMLDDIVKIIHKQNGVKELIQESVKPNGKYIYFCPVLSDDGKNDMQTIMDRIMIYLREKYPDKRIVFYKTTSADGDVGKYNRDCFYRDVDLDGRDASDTIRIMFAKNQYNEGVHAPNVDGVFLGRRTSSDIVAFEQIGRALSVRGNTREKIEEYSRYALDELREIAISRGIPLKEDDTKEQIIEKLISPIIIDLADSIEFIEELDTNLGNRVREVREHQAETKRVIKITDSSFDIEIINKNVFGILKEIRGKLRAKTWDEMYALAVAYYEYYGHSEIKHGFKTKNGYEEDSEGFNLGLWCSRQRGNQNVSIERKRKLELIEFRFENNFRVTEWNQKYDLLRKFYEHYGHCEVQKSFCTKDGITYDKNGVRLGEWCDTQRTKFRKKRMLEERKKKLEAINFRLLESKVDFEWEKNYNLLKAFYEHYGHCEVPKDFKTINGYEKIEESQSDDENVVNLYIWVYSIRDRIASLPKDKKDKLQAINFRFKNNLLEIEWNQKYDLLRKFYEHYGHCEVQGSFRTKDGITYDKEGVRLGEWCSTQRTQFRKNKLSKDRISKLEELNFRFEDDKIEIEWERKYTLLKAFYEHYGHSEVPGGFVTINGYEEIEENQSDDENVVKLGVWCSNQRKAVLSTKKIEMLKSLNFRFENNLLETDWNQKYNLLKAFYEHYGHSEVPKDFVTINGIDYVEKGINLEDWCSRQRTLFRKKKLFKDRISKLEELNFRFDDNKIEIEWERKYSLLKAFYEHYGHSEVPRNFTTINGYEKVEKGTSKEKNIVDLYKWSYEQRTKRNKLSQDKLKNLDLLEFRYATHAENENNKKILCDQYQIDYNKYPLLQRMSYQEMYAKIMYLSDNGYSLEVNGDLHEIFYMSNENMILKYMISKEELIIEYYINRKNRGV